MQLTTKSGVRIHVDEAEVARLVLRDLTAQEINGEVESRAGVYPRIGAECPELGGIFAGIARGKDGEPDYLLIVGPEAKSTLAWTEAGEWAVSQSQHGFVDFSLPTRKEQALCFANVPELFKPEAYWSGEQHHSGAVDAWYQFFVNGSQYRWPKASSRRVRAVRRSPIR